MLENNFCSSPWLHLRITGNGELRYCRWARDGSDPISNIRSQEPLYFFQRTMAPVRQQLLEGGRPQGCQECHVMEQHGKVSGRQRQLLKVGVRLQDFAKTMLSSPWQPVWQQSSQVLSQTPQDWQIDLGNYCNSACVFCVPESSSRLTQQLVKIDRLESPVAPNWSDDPDLVQRFLSALDHSPNIKYLHFIGGETLITPAFGTILQHLVQTGRSGDITLGFTTNLTVWPQATIDLVCEFHGVNLGMSIETLDQVNDYVRWPSQIAAVTGTLLKWLMLARQNQWTSTIRITPTALTVSRLPQVYQFALEHNTSIESCNFLYRPQFMRPTVLPKEIRTVAADDLEAWIDQHRPQQSAQIINTRNPDLSREAVLQDAASYVDYLRTAPDESAMLGDLCRYLSDMDRLRDLDLADYVPEYQDLFRTHGYRI